MNNNTMKVNFIRTTLICLLSGFGLSTLAQAHSNYVSFTASSYTVTENVTGGKIRIFVKRTGYAAVDAAVDYEITSAGVAQNGVDFVASSGTLLWANGNLSNQFFDVTILNDAVVETTETLKIKLLKPRTPSQPTASYTFIQGTNPVDLRILDEDVAPIIPTNLPPSAQAGADQTLTLAQPASLVGTASDDGLPTPAHLTVTWTLVSGPAAVVFSDPLALQTKVDFTQPGTYLLRITASDGLLSASDEVEITISGMSYQPPAAAPEEFKNIVNPNHENVEVPIQLASAGHVRMEVFDHFGDKIDTIFDSDLNAGPHTIIWDGKNILSNGAGSGLYVIMIDIDGHITKKKLVLTR